MEPTVRTRFESPVNASPSRVLFTNNLNNRSSLLTSTISGHTLSGQHTGANTSSTHISSSDNQPLQSQSHISTSTLSPSITQQTRAHPISTFGNPALSSSSISTSYLNKNNYINSSSRVISSSNTNKAGN
jgi:hypothetical protein